MHAYGNEMGANYNYSLGNRQCRLQCNVALYIYLLHYLERRQIYNYNFKIINSPERADGHPKLADFGHRENQG